MKPFSPMLRRNPLLLTALSFCLAFPSLGTQTSTKSPTAKSPAGAVTAPTNALPVQLEIPKSVFVIPANPQEGKDPFFPLSTRLNGTVVVRTNNGHTSAPVIVDLKLKGFSGTADHPLAIINNKTFEANEEGQVATPSGRVPIRCLEIKPDSVVVLVNGQERTLHLRPGT